MATVYAGKLLRVDLASGECEDVPLEDELVRTYLLGSGLAAYGGAEAWIRYVEDPDGVQVELMQVVAPEPG